MNIILSFFIGLVVVAALMIFMVVRMRRKRVLSSAASKRLWEQWSHVEATTDMHRKIVDAEKIVEHALRELGYEGTFADKLRKAGPRFSDVQRLWNAHKLRNRIAHEVGISVSASDGNAAIHAFKRALKELT